MDGHTGWGDPGTLCGGAEGTLDTGATPGDGRRRTVLLIAPRGGKEPGLVPMGFPVGPQPYQGLFGQGDVPVFGARATVDMALEALTIDVRDLEGERRMEPAAQAIDGGKVDLVVPGGAACRSRVTSSTLRTAGRRWVVCARRSARVCQSRWRTC
jgi:hypothetical protein